MAAFNKTLFEPYNIWVLVFTAIHIGNTKTSNLCIKESRV